MTHFANPASDASTLAPAYVNSLLAVLGSRDPFEVLGEMPAALGNAVRGLSSRTIAAPEGPGRWSILQVLQHLADSELVVGYRFRLVLSSDRPALVGYDQDQWVATLHRDDSDVEELLTRFSALRRSTLHLLGGLSPTDRERVGLHSERGEESLDLMTRLYAAHDLVHLAQIARIRAAGR